MASFVSQKLLAAAALIAAAAVPATNGMLAEASTAATLSAEALPAVLSVDPSVFETQDQVEAGTLASPDTSTPPASPVQTAETDAELECMAKAVLYEAGNQSRAGKLAVAQIILNRMESGRFADTICGVVNQRGQFFNTASYNPRRDTARWADAVSIAREARSGNAPHVVPGAMFFHAAHRAPSSFFRSRTRVVTLGDHVFYR